MKKDKESLSSEGGLEGEKREHSTTLVVGEGSTTAREVKKELPAAVREAEGQIKGPPESNGSSTQNVPVEGADAPARLHVSQKYVGPFNTLSQLCILDHLST